MKWELVEEPKNPCPECGGGGSHWPKTKAGRFDHRYRYPIGPCPGCDGTGDAAAWTGRALNRRRTGMPELTANEGTVIQIVRQQARQGDPVAASVIKDKARRHGVMYDGVDRALRGLIFKGLVVKPSRGFYLPALDKTHHREGNDD